MHIIGGGFHVVGADNAARCGVIAVLAVLFIAVNVQCCGAQAIAPTPEALDLFRADLKAAFIMTDGGPGTSGGGELNVILAAETGATIRLATPSVSVQVRP